MRARRLAIAFIALGAPLLSSCVEYNLGKGNKTPDGATPDISVDPVAIATTVCAAPYDDAVVATNDGDGPLTISAVTTTGSWTATATVPVTLNGGEGLRIPVQGSGDGELDITSDDPDEGVVAVPLSAAVDAPPTATITSPADATVLAEPAADQTLTGTVADADDAVVDVIWAIDGNPIASSSVPVGDVTALWPAPTPGNHTVTLSVADACSSASSTVAACQDQTTTTENLGISAWHYEGSAYWDGPNDDLVLTDALQDQVGTAFDTSAAVSGGAVDIDFDFYIGDGTGADGISLTALDTSRMSTYLGGSGCGMGYGGNAGCTAGPALPGWSIEVDTYYNEGYDPTPDDHVAFTFDGDVDNPAVWAALPEMEDTGWHTMSVHVASPHVTVAIDGTTYLDADLGGSFAFPAYVGFTAGTGGDTNRHLIRALTVTNRACE